MAKSVFITDNPLLRRFFSFRVAHEIFNGLLPGSLGARIEKGVDLEAVAAEFGFANDAYLRMLAQHLGRFSSSDARNREIDKWVRA